MNFNPNNQNTLLTKKVAALYEAMQKAGDSDLAFMVVDSLNGLANYARFLAEQEILIQQARITMDAASYRIFLSQRRFCPYQFARKRGCQCCFTQPAVQEMQHRPDCWRCGRRS